jgi:hypothetical protein
MTHAGAAAPLIASTEDRLSLGASDPSLRFPVTTQPTPISTTVKIVRPRATLPSFDIPFEPVLPRQNSLETTPTSKFTKVTPIFPPQAATQPSNEFTSDSGLMVDGMTLEDREKCRSQPHCLFCGDPFTTLACYKYNCQCQKGDPFSHYMPASDESCFEAELCLSCPPGMMPFTWGRMAICLSVWTHRTVRGEMNPLMNWTEGGTRSLPIGNVQMGRAAATSSLKDPRQRRSTMSLLMLMSSLSTSLCILLPL